MDTEIKIDIWQCFKALQRKWWLIAIIAILSFLSAYIVTFGTNNSIYFAETTVYSIAYGSYEEAIEGAYAMRTYADVITSLKVSERAANLLEEENVTGKKIQKMIDVDYSENSTVMSIFAYGADPDLTVKVVNAVSDAFVIEISNIIGAGNVQVLDKADSYEITKDGIFSKSNIRLLAVLVSVAISSLIICLIEICSTTVRSVDDCSLNDELDVIGVIPKYERI